MIPRHRVELVEYIIDASHAVEILSDGIKRDKRGRPANSNPLRLLMIGWLLANQTLGSLRIDKVHQVLTEFIDPDTQRRLGIITTRDGIETVMSRSLLDWTVRRLQDRLGYGDGTNPDLDDAERERRRNVITDWSDALLDIFNDGFTSTTFALDASGLWSWGKSQRRRPNVDELTADGKENPDAKVDRTDPDAAWGVKTSKDGRRESMFGYHLHALSRVPGKHRGKHQAAADEPRLAHRIAITSANEDIVDVSLDMFDRLEGRIRDVIVDSHYHYKSPDRWIKKLIAAGIRQHHDLRSDEVVFEDYERMRFLSGDAHCPATPNELGDLTPLGPEPSAEQVKTFVEINTERGRYAMKRHTSVKPDGSVRLACPALDGRIGCPLRAGSVQAATAFGLPVVSEPPNAATDGEPLPRCCTQETVKVTLPDKILKHTQPHFWGSPEWRTEYKKRTYVESLFGNLKNDATENLNRNSHRHVGITMVHLLTTITVVNYNLRTLRKWHENTGRGDANNPLLANVTPKDDTEREIKRRPNRKPRWAA